MNDDVRVPSDIITMNQDKGSMCFMVVQTDDDDNVLNAKILLNCVPISCNDCHNSKSVETNEISFDFSINKPDQEIESSVTKCADELKKQLSDKWK